MIEPAWAKVGFPLLRYVDTKDTRLLWGKQNPWDWIGGTCYDTGSGHVCILTACTNETPGFAKWSDLYFYMVEYDQRCGDWGWVREGGQFAKKLIPLLPPFMAGQLTALYSEMRETHQGKVDYYHSDHYKAKEHRDELE